MSCGIRWLQAAVLIALGIGSPAQTLYAERKNVPLNDGNFGSISRG
jgi:hypothetical protein